MFLSPLLLAAVIGRRPPPVVSESWPDASNTGHTGSLTPSGSDHTDNDDQVIEGLDLGAFTVRNNGVVIRNCRLELVFVGTDPWTALNCTIEDCTITGNGTQQQTGVTSQNAANLTVRRCDISGCENGIYIGVSGTFEDNYIHDFASPSNPDPHYDGIAQQGGGSDILIEHNHIVGTGLNSCVFLKSDFAPISDVVVNNNKLIGGSYTVYSDEAGGGAITNVSFTNNRMDDWAFGPVLVNGNTVTWSGNVDDSSGLTILPPA